MPSEITITVKDAEKTLKTKHLVYDDFQMKQNDPAIARCIADTVKAFGTNPDRVKVTAKFEVI